jgi:hypothetical protein
LNYFAHGIRFVDRPWFLAGTAVPDWLSVADRRVRLRTRQVTPFAIDAGGHQAELAAGVLQHLEDDRRFHRAGAFIETSAEIADLYRRALGRDNGFRPGFLGHITTELLLDGVLIERNPQRLRAYYDALAQIDAEVVQRQVNRMATRTATRLAEFIPRFRAARFLPDYAADDRLRYRLNQVMQRVRLSTLPERSEEVLRSGRLMVRERARDLLPTQWREYADRPDHSVPPSAAYS